MASPSGSSLSYYIVIDIKENQLRKLMNHHCINKIYILIIY